MLVWHRKGTESLLCYVPEDSQLYKAWEGEVVGEGVTRTTTLEIHFEIGGTVFELKYPRHFVFQDKT